MRVLFVSSSSSSRGGGESYLVFLAEALNRLGVETGLWLSSGRQMDGIAKAFEAHGPVFRQTYTNTFLRRTRSFSHLRPRLGNAGEIIDCWKAFRPDVLHLNKQCLEDGLDLLFLAGKAGIPNGCTIHITQTGRELEAFLGGWRDRVARRALRKYAGALWAIAGNRARSLEGFLADGREVASIPNGVSIPDRGDLAVARERMRKHYRETHGFEATSRVAVALGRLEPQKDPFRYLEILAALKERDPGLRGIWVGDGALRTAFEERIRSMDAEGWIHCAGWRENASDYLAMSDLYVHPARFEGLPFALLEAMAHGLPCVISPSLADDLTDMPRETWIIADPDRTGEWIGSLADPGILTRHGERARTLVSERFSQSVMAKAYLRHYNVLAGKEDEL